MNYLNNFSIDARPPTNAKTEVKVRMQEMRSIKGEIKVLLLLVEAQLIDLSLPTSGR